MNKKIIALFVLITLTLGFIIFLFSTQEGQLKAELNQLSIIKDGARLYIADKKFPNGFDLPLTISLRPGEYDIMVLAPNATVFRERVRVKPNHVTRLSITLTPDVSQFDYLEMTPTTEELAENKYLRIFPHTSENFEITADLSRDNNGNIVLIRVTITPFLPVSASGDFNLNEILAAKEKNTAEAKSWLKEQGIDDTTPIIIDSVF